MIVDDIRLHINRTGTNSVGEYFNNRGGKATKANPNPEMPFIKLAMQITTITQKKDIKYNNKNVKIIIQN